MGMSASQAERRQKQVTFDVIQRVALQICHKPALQGILLRMMGHSLSPHSLLSSEVANGEDNLGDAWQCLARRMPMLTTQASTDYIFLLYIHNVQFSSACEIAQWSFVCLFFNR